MSETVLNVPTTDLARKTQQILRSVQQGQTVMIENSGQPEAAIIDITDYRILRAVLHHYAHPVDIDLTAGLTAEAVAAETSPQARYNVVIAHYLAHAISLSRAAELLGLTGFDLRTRCLRLDTPLHSAPIDQAEALSDVETVIKWAKPST